MKVSGKRANDEDFDKECKEKEAARKRKYRAERSLAKDEDIQVVRPKVIVAVGESPPDSADEEIGEENSAKRSRQAIVGLLKRKRNTLEKNDTIESLLAQKEELKKKVEEIETQLEELNIEMKRIECENAQLRTKMKENDLWLKATFSYCTTATKREFKNAYQIAANANQIPKGNTLRLLRNTGINFSKKLPQHEEDKSALKKKIEDFAKENSSEMPDMRNQKKSIRYRHHYLTTLHEDFKHINPDIEISYSTFSSYWPQNVVKPKPGDYANCVCEKCENPALKIRALKTHKLLSPEHELETVIRDLRMEDFSSEEHLKADLEKLLEGPQASVQVKYLTWEKVETTELNRNTGRAKQATTQRVPKYGNAKELALKTLDDFQLLKEHLNRNTVIKNYVREKREEACESEKKAMLQVDWAENGQIILPNEVQNAFFGGRITYSLHTGYEYSKENSGGFVSLSDENNHKAEAINAAMEPKIKELSQRGISEVIIVSDSPISQYRNGKLTFLTSTWAKKYQIRIMWIFTEGSHRLKNTGIL